MVKDEKITIIANKINENVTLFCLILFIKTNMAYTII